MKPWQNPPQAKIYDASNPSTVFRKFGLVLPRALNTLQGLLSLLPPVCPPLFNKKPEQNGKETRYRVTDQTFANTKI